MIGKDPFPKEKTVTRTIRINEAYDEALKYEAERHGVSVNTLVDQVLRRYSHSYRYFDSLSAVTISGKTLERLLSNIPKEKMGEMGKALGEERPKNLLLLRGLPLDYNSVIWYLTELLGDTSNWYRATYHRRGEHDILHLSHGLGEGWSLFLGMYVTAFFGEVLGITPSTETLGNSVTFTIDVAKVKKGK
jgi:hypothetical protein